MVTLLATNIQINHADLAALITPFNQNLLAHGIVPAILHSPVGAQTAAMLNGADQPARR